MIDIKAAIAATRFGMGARPGDIAAARSDARGWLRAQLKTPQSVLIRADNLADTETAAREMIDNQQQRRALKRAGQKDAAEAADRQKMMRAAARQAFARDVAARNAHAIMTEASFLERWVRFWSNHFTVSIRRLAVFRLAGPYEREAIRANAFGSFKELLLAATLHPAMLHYLDNVRSIGPTTRAARRRKMGLNENLARECLELHTLGVDGGYSQADVEAFAKALTGWTIRVPALRSGGWGGTVFEPRLHESGDKKILGKRYPDNGGDQAKAVLADLANHPSTAHHIAKKLARHFISDAPPQSAVDKLAQTFRNSEGDLAALAEAVIDLDEAWGAEPQKLKTPEELLISAARYFSPAVIYGLDARKIYASLGQLPFGAPSPKGWPDVAADWAGPDALKKRLEWANSAARRAGVTADASGFLEGALGAMAGSRTRLAVAGAETRRQGVTLALMCPEFQRR